MTTGSIAISAVGTTYVDVNYNVQRLVYQGLLASGGSIAWTQRMDLVVAVYDDLAAPVRITPHGAQNPIVQYSLSPLTDPAGDPIFTMFGYDGALYSQQIFNWIDTGGVPSWEEFDLHDTGLGVVIFSDFVGLGYRLRITTDYGQIWDDAIPIDYLYALINGDPSNDYSWYTAVPEGMAMQVDESTGTFYLLCAACLDTDTWENVWFLLKSTNGVNWTSVKQWSYSELEANEYSCSLAVSDGHIYAGFPKHVHPIEYQFYVMHSDDDGATWDQATLTSPSYTRNGVINLTAHGMKAIAYLACGQQVATVFRTADGGIAWTQVLAIDIGTHWPVYALCPTVRASGDIFLVAFCAASYPLTPYLSQEATWTANEEEHSMLGEGESYICFWLSTDAGETWSIEVCPIQSRDELGNLLYWQQSVDVCLAVGLHNCFWPILLLLADDIAPCVLEERPSTKCVPFGG